MNLYLVKTMGLQCTLGVSHGTAYVVAKDAEAAYQELKKYLEIHDIGFERERTMDIVQLVASDDSDLMATKLLISEDVVCGNPVQRKQPKVC